MAVSLLCLLCIVILGNGPCAHSASVSIDNTTVCPIGFLPNPDNGGGDCVCYSSSQYVFGETVKCEYNLERGYYSVLVSESCLTKDAENESRIVEGISLLAYSNYTQIHILLNEDDIVLPSDPLDLEEWMCGPTHRAGTLCSQCDNQSSIDLNSVTLDCIRLSQCGDYSWIWYAIEILGPLTFFFVFIMIFQPILTSPEMYALILLSQLISIPINIFSSKKGFAITFSGGATWPPDIITALYGIWNLDIIRYIMPPLCFSQQPKTLHVLALDYITAIYPLFLLIVVYIFYELHHNCSNNRLRNLLAPATRLVFKVRRIVNPKASPVNAFANFLLLSHTKLVTTSVYLLLPVPLYDISGSVVRYVMYFDASVDYFSTDHLPFAILALVIFTVFVVSPAFLLLLFQWTWFQKILEMLYLKRHSLIAFVDIFHGYYKDRFDGKRDYRFFAGVYFFLHILIIVVRCLANGFILFILVGLMIVTMVTFLFFCLNPYKQTYHNKVNAAVFLYLVVASSFYLYMETVLYKWEHAQYAACVVLVYLSFFYSGMHIAYITFKIVWKLCLPSTCLRYRIFQTRDSVSSFEETVRLLRNHSNSDSDISFDSDLSVPDRIVHPTDNHGHFSQADNNRNSPPINQPYSIQELPELS